MTELEQDCESIGTDNPTDRVAMLLALLKDNGMPRTDQNATKSITLGYMKHVTSMWRSKAGEQQKQNSDHCMKASQHVQF